MNAKKTLRTRIKDMESRLNATQDRFRQWGQGWRPQKRSSQEKNSGVTLDALEISVKMTGNNLRRLSQRLDHSIERRKEQNQSVAGVSQGRESTDRSRKGARTSCSKPTSQEDRSAHDRAFLVDSPEEWLDFLGTRQLSLEDQRFPASFKKEEADFHQRGGIVHRKTNTSVQDISETELVIRNLMKDVEELNAEVQVISGKNAELIRVIDSFKDGKDTISDLVFATETKAMRKLAELTVKLRDVETHVSVIETHIVESLKDTLEQLRDINEFAKETMGQMTLLKEAKNNLEVVLQQTKDWARMQITDLETELASSRTENAALFSHLSESKASFITLSNHMKTLECGKAPDSLFSEQLETLQTALAAAEDRLRLQRVEIQELNKELSDKAEREEMSRDREEVLREEVWRLRQSLMEVWESEIDLDEQGRTDKTQGQQGEYLVSESEDRGDQEKVDNSEETSHYIADLMTEL